MPDIVIGIVASSREWRSVLQAHVRDHVAGVRVQILREPRMALELDLDVVVIDDVSSFLTRDKVVRLREKGTRVVGVYDPEGHEGLGISFLENLGVDLSLPSTISPEEMINAVSQLQPRENYAHTFDHIVEEYATGITPDIHSADSTLIAVGGPSGAGATEIAIALSDVLVARRNATLLLDCDEVGPSVARRLGFHLHPNILSAMDTVSNVTRPLTEMVGRPTDRVASAVSFDVIPGIANPEDWTQLRSMDLADLFIAARKSWRYVVCNTGPFLEDLSGYGMERFGSTRATVEHADVIIGVMSPTPTGYMRFLDWMSSLRTLGADRSVIVVVNKTPKSGYLRNEIETQLSRDVDSRFIGGLFFIPDDERVSRAEWEGQRVPRGPFLTGVAEVATYAVPMEYKRAKKKPAPIQIPPTGAATGSGYSSGFENTSVQAGALPPQAPITVSWDDPDIATPPVQDSVAVPEVVETVQPVQPTQASQEIKDLEASLSQTMNPIVEQPAPAPVDNSNPYSYSPPMHAVEEFPKAPAPAPQAPVVPAPVSPVNNEDYVPAFKRGTPEDPSMTGAAPDTYIPTAPTAPVVDTSAYTQPPQQNEANSQTGYVPGFIDQEKDKTDDDSFWGE